MEDTVSRLVLGNIGEKKRIFIDLRRQAILKGIISDSIYTLYRLESDFCLPAFNLRGLTYDLALAIFAAAKRANKPRLIFELARSEFDYTHQHPFEYAGLILKAAIDTDWSGPLFLQGDHFQLHPERYGHTLKKELHIVKSLIKDCRQAGFYNFDIDCSTLSVDDNVYYSANLIRFVDYLQNRAEKKYGSNHSQPTPKINLSLELDAIGSGNTQPAELQSYLDKIRQVINLKEPLGQVTKIAVQVGTEHGGQMLSSGQLKKINLDYDLLGDLNTLARKNGLAGVVLHGASTLDEEQLVLAVETGIIEVHLATGWQNLVFDHPDFPPDLKKKMKTFMDKTYPRPAGQSDQEFYYKNRKYCWGVFKKEWLGLPDSFRTGLRQAMTDKAGRILEIMK
jgi:fructose/tagatose bisphosphate aldolase